MRKNKDRKTKLERRKAEVLRAQVRSGLQGEYGGQRSGDVKVVEPIQARKLTQRLPLKEIRTDLIKTGIFAVFVIALLIILKNSGLSLDLGIYK